MAKIKVITTSFRILHRSFTPSTDGLFFTFLYNNIDQVNAMRLPWVEWK